MISYPLRISLPMLILLAHSWATLFVGEYHKLIEVAGANLLVFIAFNWTVSTELPKLGYLTFPACVLQCMLHVTGLILCFTVILSWLKARGLKVFAANLNRRVII